MILVATRPESGNGYKYSSKSHSAEITVYAFSNHPVGIDIEKKDRQVKNWQALAKRFFHNEEHVLTPEEFLILWTRKEAYTKLLGIDLIKSISNKTPDFVKNYAFFDGYFLAVAGHDFPVFTS